MINPRTVTTKSILVMLASATLVGSFAPLSRAAPSDLEPPIATTNVQIDREIDGNCSAMRAGDHKHPAALEMTNLCHGWEMAPCGDKLVFNGAGVIEDQEAVLFTTPAKKLDIVGVVDRAIARRWPDHQHLHLTFGKARCDQPTIMIPFEGSHMKRGTSGSAAGMKGVIQITAPTVYSVSIKGDDR